METQRLVSYVLLSSFRIFRNAVDNMYALAPSLKLPATF